MISNKRSLKFIIFKKKGQFNLLDYLPESKGYFFSASARGGLEACIRLLGITSNDSVLLPAFIAEGVISPFQKKKIKIIRYKSDQKLCINVDDIKEKIIENKSIKCIVIIHYFGFPQEFGNIKSFCEANNVIIFEDCAQALFSKSSGGQLLGSFGDISFFSLPKILPVPDGSIFLINNSKYSNIAETIKEIYQESFFHNISVSFHFAYLLLKNIELKLNYGILYVTINYFSKILYGIYYSSLKRINGPVRISKLTLNLLSRFNYPDIIDKRRKNIESIYNNIKRDACKFLFPVYNSNFLPIGVPVISEDRDKITRKLKTVKNIECQYYSKGWHFLPDNLNIYFNEIEFSRNHYLLPVKEGIAIDEMIGSINSVSTSHKN